MPVYIRGKDLYNETLKSLKRDELTLNLTESFIVLVDRVSRKFHYFNEDDRLDCKQQALHDLFANWRNFDPEKSNNAFAYFTEITKRGMASGWKELTRQKGNEFKGAKRITHISIERTCDGDGFYNL